MGWERAQPLCEGINSKASIYRVSMSALGL